MPFGIAQSGEDTTMAKEVATTFRSGEPFRDWLHR